MSKTIGLLVASAGTLTRTIGARGFDSSRSVIGGFCAYCDTNDVNSACSAGDNGSPVTGWFRNAGDDNCVLVKTIVNTSVPGFLSSVILLSCPFGKMNSLLALT